MNIIDWLNGIRKKPAVIQQYCRECGKKIVVKRDGDNFDQKTGEPGRYIVTAYCPNPTHIRGYEQRFHYLKRWYEPVEVEAAIEYQEEIKE
jgi:hypothetical protein